MSCAAAAVAGTAATAQSLAEAPATRVAASATRKASDIPDDVVWHDVRDWGVEGRAFDDTRNYFDRLPGRARGVVRDAVWNLSRHTSGMAVYFEADAPTIFLRYALLNAELAMPHMPATGVSGVDLYAMTDGGWRWVATHLPRAQSIQAQLITGLAPRRCAYHLNLPLYNGVTSLEIGVPKGAAFTPTAPRKDKPILFYGTSITQGGCASRPGMSFTSILGRRLNRPMLNFGFSGNGKTELEVARFLAELDPAMFVIDTVANTSTQQIRQQMEPLVRLLRQDHPITPVLLLDERTHDAASLVPGLMKDHRERSEALQTAYDNLIAVGVPHLHLRKGEDFMGDDGEGAVDGSHPADLGMMRYARALEPEVRSILNRS
jgi:lysophospholipase L1-like esterase